MKQIIFTILISSFATTTYAYVPRLKTIAQKIAKNNGTQSYLIEKELSLFSKENKTSFSEKWWIKSGDAIRVDSSGKNPDGTPWMFSIVYKNNLRTTTTPGGNEKSIEQSPYFFEPLFHYKNQNSIIQKLISLRMAPSWANKIPPVRVAGKSQETEFTNEAFVKLSRKLGLITYEIGSSVEKESASPQLWVEQDSFLIKKGQLDRNIYFQNDSHREYSGGLNYPLNQTINWGDLSVQSNTVNVKTLTEVEVSKKINENLGGSSAKLPTENSVKDFYSRFR